MMTLAIFLGTFAALLIGYGLWSAINRAVTDLDARQTRYTCRARDGGRYMGSDRNGFTAAK